MGGLITTVGVVVIINVLSRALALVSGVLVTSVFGVTAQTSAYSFALTLTNAITTVIGTTLTTAVIPIYTRLKQNSLERANYFINNTLTLTVICAVVLAIIGALTSPLTASLAKDGDYNFAIYAICTMMPAIIFICLYFVFSGLLQANDRFFAVAMVSIPSSLINMAYIIFASKYFGVKGLVVSTMIGFFVQAFVLVFPMRKLDFRFKLSFDYANEDIKGIINVLGPIIIGVCSYQINIITNSAIALAHDSERYIILNNVQNLGIQIVMTIILAVAAVMYPKFSLLAAQDKTDEHGKQYLTTINATMLVLAPVTLIFIVCAKSIVNIVYGYGKFTPDDVAFGGGIFALYAISFIGLGLKELTDKAFYSLKNTKTSAYNGIVVMTVNILLSAAFVRIWGFYGIALAYSVAALTGAANIMYQYRKKYKLLLKPVFVTLIKMFISSAVMAVVCVLTNKLQLGSGKIWSVIQVGVVSVAGTIVYAIMLCLLKTTEVVNLIDNIKIKFKQGVKNR